MSRFIIHCAAAIVAVAAFSLSALAQGQIQDMAQDRIQSGPSFESLDSNKDGQISINEATSNDALFTAFKSLDKDQDGALSKREFAAYRE